MAKALRENFVPLTVISIVLGMTLIIASPGGWVGVIVGALVLAVGVLLPGVARHMVWRDRRRSVTYSGQAIRSQSTSTGKEKISAREQGAYIIAREVTPEPALQNRNDNPKGHASLEAAPVSASRPRMFLSYSSGAHDQACLLKQALESKYEVVDYQGSAGIYIADEAKRRINESDYFVGLWREDESIRMDGSFGVSPSLVVEYSVALAAEKRILMFYSESLNAFARRKIYEGTPQSPYRDIQFTSQLDDDIISFLREKIPFVPAGSLTLEGPLPSSEGEGDVNQK